MIESERVWVYAVDGRRFGPSSAREIADQVSSGRFSIQTLVWRAEISGWAAAGDVPEISRYCAPPLPRRLGGNRREPALQLTHGEATGPEVREGNSKSGAGLLAGSRALPKSPSDDTMPPRRPSVARVPFPPGVPLRPERTGKWLEGLKVLVFIFIMSVGGAIGRGIGRTVVSPTGSLADRPTSEAFLSRSAEQINRQIGVPKMLDADTQLIRVDAVEGTLIYQNRFISLWRDQVDPPALEATYRQALLRGAGNGSQDLMTKMV